MISVGPASPASYASPSPTCANGAGNPMVLGRLLWSLGHIAAATPDLHRRTVLAAEVARVAECAGRRIPAPHERDEIVARAAELRNALAGPA